MIRMRGACLLGCVLLLNGCGSGGGPGNNAAAPAAPVVSPPPTAATNRAPAGTDLDVSTSEDQPLAIDLQLADADGDALSIEIRDAVAHGKLSVDGSGSSFTAVYEPAADYHGNDRFTFIASDGSASSSLISVNITVQPVNDSPMVAAVMASTSEDLSLTGSLSATDIDGDTLSFASVSQPASGLLEVDADGNYRYVPAADYNGTDSFQYSAADPDGAAATATVTITVAAVNDAPTAGDDQFITGEDLPLTIGGSGLLANDADIDGDTLQAILTSAPTHGSVELAPDGSFTYVPAANFAGMDQFAYQASDGSVAGDALVTIMIMAEPDAPVAEAASATTAEDTAVAGLLLASDADGDALDFALAQAPASGTLDLNADGSYLYTPNADFHGNDSFAFQASDASSVSLPATVAITVTPVNDVPLATAAMVIGDEDATINGELLATDADGDQLQYRASSPPANGTLSVQAGGLWQYEPGADFNGTDSFSFVASDGNADSTPATVSIEVRAVNDAPRVLSLPVETVIAGDVYEYLILASDPENDAISFRTTSPLPPWLGMLERANGELLLAGIAVHDDVGQHPLEIELSDARGAFALHAFTLQVSNAVPSFSSSPLTTIDEDQPYAYDIVAADPEGRPLTLTAASPLPAWLGLTDFGDGRGQLLGFATDAEIGVHAVEILATDPAGAVALQAFTVTVRSINDAPVFETLPVTTVDEDATYLYEVQVSDEDPGDVITIRPASPLPPWVGILDQGGGAALVVGIAVDTDVGDHEIELEALDQAGGRTLQTYTLTVVEVNDPPRFLNSPPTTAEAGAIYLHTILVNDEEDGGAVTIGTQSALPPWLGLLDLGNGSAKLTGIADPADEGDHAITLTATDGDGLVATQSFILTVTVSNQAPEGVSLTASGLVENAPAGSLAGTLSSSDNDPDDQHSYLLVAGPGDTDNTAFSIEGEHLLSAASLDFEEQAQYSLRVRSTDLAGATVESTLTVALLDVDEAPVTAQDEYPVAIGNTLLAVGETGGNEPAVRLGGSLLSNDADPEQQPLSIATPGALLSQAGGEIELFVDGSFHYLPPAGFSGTDRFDYRVSDGSLEADGSATITVEGAIWYVDATPADPAGRNDGRSASPFRTIAAALAASAPGEQVHVHGGVYGDGVILQDGQMLSGAQTALTVAGVVLAAAEGDTVVSGTAGSAAIVLARDNRIEGLSVVAAGSGIVGTDVGNFSAGTHDGGAITVIAGGGPALDLDGSGMLNLNFAELSSTGSPNHGVRLDGIAAGSAITVRGALRITDASDTALRYSGGGAGATLHLSELLVNSASGVQIDAETGTQLALGEVRIETTAGDGLSINGAATLTVSGNDNFVLADGGTALALRSTVIGADGVQFSRIDSNGGQNGIVLENIAGEQLNLGAGTGVAGAAGTLSGSESAAVFIASSSDITLADLIIEHNNAAAVQALESSNLTLDNLQLRGNGGAAAAAAILLEEGSGLYALSNLDLSDNQGDGLALTAASSTLDSLYAGDLLISNVPAGHHAIVIEQSGTSALSTGLLERISVDASAGGGIRAGASEQASIDALLLDDSDLATTERSFYAAATGAASARYELSNVTASSDAATALMLFGEGEISLDAIVRNSVVHAGALGGNGAGVVLRGEGVAVSEQPRMRMLLQDNTIASQAGHGLLGQIRSSAGSFDLTLTGNTVSTGSTGSGDGIHLAAGNGRVGERDRLSVNANANEASGGAAGYALRARAYGPRFELACAAADCGNLIGTSQEGDQGVLALGGNTTDGLNPAVVVQGIVHIILPEQVALP